MPRDTGVAWRHRASINNDEERGRGRVPRKVVERESWRASSYTFRLSEHTPPHYHRSLSLWPSIPLCQAHLPPNLSHHFNVHLSWPRPLKITFPPSPSLLFLRFPTNFSQLRWILETFEIIYVKVPLPPPFPSSGFRDIHLSINRCQRIFSFNFKFPRSNHSWISPPPPSSCRDWKTLKRQIEDSQLLEIRGKFLSRQLSELRNFFIFTERLLPRTVNLSRRKNKKKIRGQN